MCVKISGGFYCNWVKYGKICSGLNVTGQVAVIYVADFSVTGQGAVRYVADFSVTGQGAV